MKLPKKVLIKQEVEALELFTGFETNNRYSILNESGVKLLYAYEESGFFIKQILGSHRPLDIHVIDDNQEVQFSLQRPFYWFKSYGKVYDKNNGIIAEFQQEKFMWIVASYVITIPSTNARFTVRNSARHPWTYVVKQGDREVARVLRKWAGVGREMFTDASKFMIDSQELKDENIKQVLIALSLLIDLSRNERKS